MPVLKLSSLNQNLQLYYEIYGEGEIKILFIMGLLTEGVGWYRQVRQFLHSTAHILLSRLNFSLNNRNIKYCLSHSFQNPSYFSLVRQFR